MPVVDKEMNNPMSGLSTEHSVAILVIGSLLALIILRRGFRGVGVPGVGSVSFN